MRFRPVYRLHGKDKYNTTEQRTFSAVQQKGGGKVEQNRKLNSSTEDGQNTTKDLWSSSKFGSKTVQRTYSTAVQQMIRTVQKI
jgi:hypothetical protein